MVNKYWIPHRSKEFVDIYKEIMSYGYSIRGSLPNCYKSSKSPPGTVFRKGGAVEDAAFQNFMDNSELYCDLFIEIDRRVNQSVT